MLNYKHGDHVRSTLKGT